MTFLLLPIGSEGDVLPLVGLGHALQARGHRVLLATAGVFEASERQTGLQGVDIGLPAEDRQRFQALLALDTSREKPDTRLFFLPYLRPQYRLIARLAEQGPLALIAPAICLAARCAQEALGLPLITIYLEPSALRAPPPPSLEYGPTPAWLEHALEEIVDDRMALLNAELDELRTDIGLAPLQAPLRSWWHSPLCGLGLFPEWFGARQPSWPAQLRRTGFPQFDVRGQMTALPAELKAFLDRGAPPVVVSTASWLIESPDYFRAALEACQQLGRRCLLPARCRRHLPERLPDTVGIYPYVPFSLLLPRAAALVHHGGIGTCGQALAAGIPQLIVPRMAGQEKNASILEAFGVARHLAFEEFTAPAVAAALRDLLEGPGVLPRCRELAERLRGANALEDSCRIIEERVETVATIK